MGAVLLGASVCTGSSVPVREIRENQRRTIREAAPLDIEGIVTYFDAARDLVVIQDRSGALAVRGTSERFSMGEHVMIHADDYIPYVPEIDRFPFKPDRTERVGVLEISSDTSRFYVDRLRGRIVVPADGEYTFFLSADDSGELWFSSDGAPEHAQKIAVLTEWAELHDFTRYPSQKSAPIYLRAGQICYIECLHEQQQGNSSLSVVWSGPGFERSPIGISQGPDFKAKSQRWSDLPPGVFLREVWNRAEVGELSALSQVRYRCDEVTVQGVTITRLGITSLAGPENLSTATELHHTYSYCTAEGTAEQVSTNADGIQFQVVSNEHRYAVHINGAYSAHELERLEHTQLRLTGVYKPLTVLRGDQPSAALLLASTNQIERLSLNANWDELPVLDLSRQRLLADESQGGRKKMRGRVVGYRADGAYEMRDEGYFAAYASADGNAWTLLGPELSIPLSDTIHGGFILAPHTGSAPGEAVFDQTRGLDGTLEKTHVGEDQKEGTVERTSSQIKLAGYGGDTWNSSDDFQYLSQAMNGGGEIVTRIVQLATPHPEGKAGVMMRESLSSRSAFAEVVYHDDHIKWIYRNRDPGSRAIVQGSLPASLPFWVRLRRGFHTVIVHPRSGSKLRIGDDIEVAGYPTVREGSIEIDSVVARDIPSDLLRDEPTPVQPLVSIGQVAYLPNDKRPNTLRLRGIVTYSGSYRGRYYLSVQDDTGATFISDNDDPEFFRPRIGQTVDVYGAPVFATSRDDLNVSKVVPLDDGVLPSPVHHPAELLFPGNGAAYWTQVEGVIYHVDQAGTAFLRCNSGVMSVAIDGRGADFWRTYIDCLVRVRGVIAYPSPAAPCLLVPDPSYLTALETVPRPTSNVAIIQLGEVDPQTFISTDKHRVRVAGTVTLADAGLVMMQEDNVGIAVELVEPSDVKVGENAVAIGFPSANGSKMLMESEVKGSGKAEPINARATTLSHLRSREFDGLLVKVSGFLVRQSRSEAGQVLELQDNSGAAVAIMKGSGETILDIPAESRVVLTGVCLPLDSTFLSRRELPDAANSDRVILLRSRRDISVIEHPRWWRLKRTAEVMGALIAALIALFAWIYILRKRVEQRTQQLADTMRQLKKETEVSTLLAERNRLAAEIHDSIEQGFSAVLLQLDVANRLNSYSEELRKSLNLAHTMLVFSRAELRNTVWDLYSSEVEAIDLPRAIRRIVSQFVSDIVELNFEVIGDVRKLSQTTEHQLIRIAQEAITNAVKHARAATISIVLKYAVDSVDLTISDNGHGFHPETALSTKEGHFGLRSMKTRAKKIRAQLKIVSEPGRGCGVHVHMSQSK